MNIPPSLLLEFPAMLHGLTGAIRRELRAQGRRWAREYLETGRFAPPRRMLQVPPGEVLIMHSVADSNLVPQPRWSKARQTSTFSAGLERRAPAWTVVMQPPLRAVEL